MESVLANMIWGEIQTLVPDADVVDVCSLREYERAHDYNVVDFDSRN